MRHLRWFIFGIAFACLVAGAAGAWVVVNARGFSASAEPGAVERWVARKARAAALPAEARTRPNPIPNSDQVLAQARAHWADHCAGCHANDGSGDTALGKRSYPPAPDMRLAETQQLSDGELFFMIENGIRLSGMPAWGGGPGHSADDSWKLVHFIRHLPQLTADEKAAMAKLNPKSPDEIKEEQDEENFLKGIDNHEQATQHHHH